MCIAVFRVCVCARARVPAVLCGAMLICQGCGVVWCGMVWYGVVWCGVVWCGVVWCAKGAVTKRQWPGWSCTQENASREGCV